MVSPNAPDSEYEDYERLLDRWNEIVQLEGIENLLFWDQQVMMPPGGTPARSEQRGTVSSLRHRLLTDDRMGALIQRVDEDRLDDGGRAAVREIEHEYDRAVSVDEGLLTDLSRVTAAANDTWKEARSSDEYGTFAPDLERLVELKREYAAQVDPDAEPFEALYQEYEPYLGIDVAETTLDRLRRELVPLIEDIRNSGRSPGDGAFTETYDSETQMELSEAALDFAGLDRRRARLDVSPHPFSYGNRYDVRITTRFDEHHPINALTSTLHEFGHTAYTHGLSEEHFGDPLGMARSHAIHESQSRFFENHICRSLAFWEEFMPTVRAFFPSAADVSPEAAYATANQVYEDNYIRVEADELTYHMHILLRFEVERALINGDIEVDEVPQVWNDKMEKYLGIRPPSDTVGCLQDIHWSLGRIGTFQNYTLGTVFAAQIQYAMEDDLGPLSDLVHVGAFDEIHAWLTDHVHQHGRRYPTDELIEVATGEPLTADYFVDHVTAKYTDLYDL